MSFATTKIGLTALAFLLSCCIIQAGEIDIEGTYLNTATKKNCYVKSEGEAYAFTDEDGKKGQFKYRDDNVLQLTKGNFKYDICTVYKNSSGRTRIMFIGDNGKIIFWVKNK